MKQKDKTKSTVVAGTLLAGAVFILSITFQHSNANEKEHPTNDIINKINYFEPLLDSNEIKIVYSSDDSTSISSTPTSFSNAFKLAREEFGPGHTFVWDGNLYLTDRDDDRTDSVQLAIDIIAPEQTSSVNVD